MCILILYTRPRLHSGSESGEAPSVGEHGSSWGGGGRVAGIDGSLERTPAGGGGRGRVGRPESLSTRETHPTPTLISWYTLLLITKYSSMKNSYVTPSHANARQPIVILHIQNRLQTPRSHNQERICSRFWRSITRIRMPPG